MEKELTTISELLTKLKVLNSNLESTVKEDYVDLIARTLEVSATAGVSIADFDYELWRLAAEYLNVGEKAIQSAMYSAWENLSPEARDALKDTWDQVDTKVHVDKFAVAAGRHVSSLDSAWENLLPEARDALKDTWDQVDTKVHVDKFAVAAGRHVSSLEHSLEVDFAVLDSRIMELLDQLRKLSAVFRTGS